MPVIAIIVLVLGILLILAGLFWSKAIKIKLRRLAMQKKRLVTLLMRL